MKSRSARGKPPVKKSRSARRKSARRKSPVKKSRSARRKSARRKSPVKKSRSARRKSARRKPPVKKSRSARRKSPVKKSRSARRKSPVKKSRSARRKPPVKKSRSALRKLPVKKSRSARRKNQKIMLKGGGGEEEVGEEEEKCTINLVIENVGGGDDKMLIRDEYHVDKFIYKNDIAQNYEKENIFLLNKQAHDLYQSAKFKKVYNNMLYNELFFPTFYDIIGSLYICSKKIQNVWNEIAHLFKFKIAIFNGSNSGFRHIKETDYIVGLNILMSCSSKRLAENLNGKHNTKGKYFIGIDGMNHNYGSSFYTCIESIKIDAKDFISEYEKYPDEFPILRIIKIFFNKYKYNVAASEKCSVLTIIGIIHKLYELQPKIIAKTPFNKRDDNYFNSKFQKKCLTEEMCTIDVDFENYIRKIITTIDKETPNNTDITKIYQQFFDKSQFDEEFDVKEYNSEHDTIVDKFEKEYKIYIKKSNSNRNEYFFIKRINSEDESDSFYINKLFDLVNADGSEKDSETHDIDITKIYERFFDKSQFNVQVLEVKEYNEQNGTIVDEDYKQYKIYLKKSNRKKYFFIKRINSKDENDNFYINKECTLVNSDGSENELFDSDVGSQIDLDSEDYTKDYTKDDTQDDYD